MSTAPPMLDHPLDIRPADAPASEPVTFAWHFLPLPGKGGLHRLTHGDNRVVRVGKTLSVKVAPGVGCRGLHASADPLRALGDAPGFTLCRVALWGDVDEDDEGRIAARHRHVLWMAEADDVRPAVLAFAVGEAERALNLAGSPDVRSLAAVEAVRAHLRGEEVDLKAASKAAAEAASKAAAEAAWAAAEAAWAAAAAAEARESTRARQTRDLNAILFALAPNTDA